MKLVSLTVKNFRNLEAMTFLPGEGVTLLHGANAQGKTNLLEAVYLCCTGRSHRTSHDTELIAYDKPDAYICADCRQRDGIHRVEIALSSQGRKSIRINGTPLNRIGGLMGHMNAVLFAPEDLEIIKSGPANRRRFVDMTLSQVKPSYFYALQKYRAALYERNTLIRTIQQTGKGQDMLDIWEQQLAQSGASVMAMRRGFAQRLSVLAQSTHSSITGGAERLELKYETCADGEDGSQLEEQLMELFLKQRDIDLRRGTTTIGPHHDDIVIMVNGGSVRAFGSQGQKRTCALSLKLAQIDIMRQHTGEAPILLLDDVFSELDVNRRRMLLEHMKDVQTILTCVDREQITSQKVNARLYRVNGGRLNMDAGHNG